MYLYIVSIYWSSDLNKYYWNNCFDIATGHTLLHQHDHPQPTCCVFLYNCHGYVILFLTILPHTMNTSGIMKQLAETTYCHLHTESGMQKKMQRFIQLLQVYNRLHLACTTSHHPRHLGLVSSHQHLESKSLPLHSQVGWKIEYFCWPQFFNCWSKDDWIKWT